MVTQTNTNNYDLYFLCVHCEQRLLVSPRKTFLCPPRPILHLHIIKIFFFTCNLRSKLYSVWMSRKTDFRKRKITLVASTYPGQRPQCPSLSPHVLLMANTITLGTETLSGRRHHQDHCGLLSGFRFRANLIKPLRLRFVQIFGKRKKQVKIQRPSDKYICFFK